MKRKNAKVLSENPTEDCLGEADVNFFGSSPESVGNLSLR